MISLRVADSGTGTQVGNLKVTSPGGDFLKSQQVSAPAAQNERWNSHTLPPTKPQPLRREETLKLIRETEEPQMLRDLSQLQLLTHQCKLENPETFKF